MQLVMVEQFRIIDDITKNLKIVDNETDLYKTEDRKVWQISRNGTRYELCKV